MRRSTSSPEPRSVTTAPGTSFGPAYRALVTVVGADGNVEVAVAEAVAAVEAVAAEAAVPADDAADLVVGARPGTCLAGGAGRFVVAVVDVSRAVVLDGLDGAAPAVEDVAGSPESSAAVRSGAPPPLQAGPARNRTHARATERWRTARTISRRSPPPLSPLWFGVMGAPDQRRLPI